MILENVTWKEYLLKDFFEIYHGKRLKKEDRIPGDLPLITAGETNQGVAEYIGNDWPAYQNPITVDMFGNCFYHDGLYTGDDNIYFFINHDLSAKSKLFIVTVASKVLKGLYSYGLQFRQKDADKLSILLPATQTGEPDWGFMEDYISEIEKEYLELKEAETNKEINAYFEVSGIDDYELTDEDKKVLKAFENINCEEFRIVNLFDVKNTHSILKQHVIFNSGNIPYVTASAENNAVTSYIKCENDEWLEKGHCILIGGKSAVVTYQENDFVSNDSHNLALYAKDDISKYSYLYVVTVLKQYLSLRYSWSDSVSNKKIQNDTIFLPVREDGQPDWEFMERYIKVIEKIAVKDAVKWKNEELKVLAQNIK